jgi:hypothetical protein
MLRHCPKSCAGECCVSSSDEIEQNIARQLDKQISLADETELAETAYGLKQYIYDENSFELAEIMANYTFYMRDLIMEKGLEYLTIKKTCKNRSNQCAYWRSLGECQRVSLENITIVLHH